uniref:BTB domain-containing protein n=1 Tax=Leersia perrieri TaxID=77586 RepID=A0A0D9WLB8_9ORYZ
MEPSDRVDGCKLGDQTTSDVRVCFKRIDEQAVWFCCHSSVLLENSKYFADWLSRNDIGSNSCIEVECAGVDYQHCVKALKLMYLPKESISDSFDSVRSAVGVLRVSSALLKCEFITRSCIEYLEAASWDEKEEEEILQVAQSLGSEETVALLARLQAPSAFAVKNVFISAIRFATSMESPLPPFLDDLKTSAQEQIDFMLHEDDDTALVTMDEDVRSLVQEGLKKLLSMLKTGLDMLTSEYDQSPEQAEQRVLCSLADIDWMANFLTKIEMMNEFVSGWSEISNYVLSVVEDKKYSSGLWVVKAKLIEVTGKALDAVGYGSVVLPSSSRVHFLQMWLPFMQTTKRLLDEKYKDDTISQMDADLFQNIESAIVSLVLALPSGDQADILAEWMKKAEQFRYPDLTEAFEVWCYRSKTAKRRLVGGLNGSGNPTVSL